MLAPCRLRSLVRGFVVVAWFFCAASVAVHAQGGTLWVAESVGAFRIATADGTVLGEIEGLDQEVSALAVDPVADRVWLYSGNNLLAYGLDGEPELSAPVPGFPFQVPQMAIDPLAGTVWLADLVLYSPRVTGFDASGQVIADEIAPERVRALAVDSQSGLVWVAGERDLYAYDTTSGIAASTLSLDPSAPPIQTIAVGAGGALWVATQDDLRRLASDGTEELRTALPGLRKVAADGAGGAWAAGTMDVVRVGEDGTVSAQYPASGVLDLAPDGRDGSVWVGTVLSIAHLGDDGEAIVTLSIPLLNLGPFVLVRDIDLWRPAVPPSVTIEAPEDGAEVAASRPDILLAFTQGDQPVDPQSLALTADGLPLPVDCELDTAGGSCTPVAPLAEGPVTLTVTIADVAGRLSDPATVSFTVDTVAPVVTLASPQDGQLTNQPDLVLTGGVSEPAELTLAGTPVTVAPDLSFSHGPVTLSEGPNTLTLTATDLAGNTGTLTVTLTLDTMAPPALQVAAIQVTPPDAGQVTVTGGPGAAEAGATVTVGNGGTGVSVEAAADGSFTLALAAAADDVLTAFQADAAGNVGPTISLTVPSPEPGEDLPPDPATVAPPLDRTVATDVATATEFLYTGADPIQTGVAAGTIEARRVAVLRGRVLDRQGQVVPGVAVSIHGHPELGGTLSRADGMFDLAVNGGGPLVVEFEKEGYLAAQRPVVAPVRDYRWLDDVALVTLDGAVTSILSGQPGFQVARSGAVTDADGTRRTTLLFPPGTTTSLVLPDGSEQPVATLSIRATEYSVGAEGRMAMPGPLPPNTGYTYAVELSADEAMAAGAVRVELSQPAIHYVENFLGFPVGDIVPVGYYDREMAAWVPSDNGFVVEVLSVDGGVAELDVDGSGLAADETTLGDIGISLEERQALAALYTAGQSLWRVMIPHLTPWDCNWPYGPPEDAEPPPPPDDHDDSDDPDDPDDDEDDDPSDHDQDEDSDDEDENDCQQGSIIECQSQILREVVDLDGSSMQLHYGSDRVPGRGTFRIRRLRVSGSSVPASLRSIDFTVTAAGKTLLRASYPAAPDIKADVSWDGKDAYGRPVQAAVPITVTTTYNYEASYYGPAEFRQSFSRFPTDGGVALRANRSGGEVAISRTFTSTGRNLTRNLGSLDWREVGLGGWSLSTHHLYDPTRRALYPGYGGRRSADRLGSFLIRKAGTGEFGEVGDGGLARQGQLNFPRGIALAPDGSLYIADTDNNQIRRVSPEGVISTVAGTGDICEADGGGGGPVAIVVRSGGDGPCGAGGPALEADLSEPSGVAVAPDGRLYIADTSDACVRRLEVDGTLTTVAGRCESPFGGGVQSHTPPADPSPESLRGGRSPAGLGAKAAGLEPSLDFGVEAFLDRPVALAFNAEGGLYIADEGENVVYFLGTDGRISLMAGGDSPPDEVGDGLPATSASLLFPSDVAVTAEGTLLIADFGNDRVREVGLDGVIHTVAGTGVPGFSGDGGLAVDAQLDGPAALAVAPDGGLYVAEGGNGLIRYIDPEGVVSTFAGSGDFSFGQVSPDGTAALRVALGRPLGLDLTPDGALLVSDYYNAFVGSFGTDLPGFTGDEIVIPDANAGLAYVFDLTGRHLRTLNALTGAQLLEFHYSADGLLTEVEDAYGNLTQIERDASGAPEAIVAPFGQRTELTLDGDGYLATISDPADIRSQSFTYDQGLMISRVDPRGGLYEYDFDLRGRLIGASDPAGGSKTLRRSDRSGVENYTISLETAEGHRTGYRVDTARGSQTRKTLDFTALGEAIVTTETRHSSGTVTRTLPSGTVVVNRRGPDSVWSAGRPRSAHLELRLPSGLTSTTTVDQDIQLADPEDPFSVVGRSSRIDVNGRTFESLYDGSTKETTWTTPEGRSVVTVNDPRGRLVESRVPGIAPLEVGYDAAGHLASITQGSGIDARVVSFSYDAEGRLEAITDPLARTVTFAYDSLGRAVTYTYSDGRVVGVASDPSGNLTGLTPPGGPSHRFAYTPVDLPQEELPPPVGAGSDRTSFHYDLDRRLTGVDRPDGSSVQFDYDPGGRLVSITAPEGATTVVYRPGTQDVALMTAPDGGTLSYGYDGALITSATWAGDVSGSVERSYDSNFRVIQRTVNGGFPVAFSYDQDGLLTAGGGLTVERDPVNGLVIGTSLGQLVTDRSRNQFAETVAIGATFAGAPLLETSYTRDALGRVTSKRETIGGVVDVYEYVYDGASRLVQTDRNGILSAEYTYDTRGNRVGYQGPFGMATGVYDDQDRLLSYGNITFSYTANGELATRTVNGQTISYDYGTFGGLAGVTLADGLRIDYVDDARTRRIGKKVGGILVRGYLYKDRLNPVAELDGTGAVVARFVYATRPHVPDLMLKGGSTYLILSDHLGSVRLVVDAATGAVAQRLDYDEFGRVVLDTHPGFQPFGFAGGLYDPQTHLVRFGTRDYDPEVGRWTAKDQIGFGGGDTNLYSYVFGDPVNSIDPPGLGGCTVDFPGYPITIPGTDVQIPLNHAGVIAYDDQGHTRYYEYGRYPPGDQGRVRRRRIPDLKLGPDGEFTEESWDHLEDELKDGPGKGHGPILHCIDKADDDEIIEFAEDRMHDPNRAPYSWNPFKPNTCVTFAQDALKAGLE